MMRVLLLTDHFSPGQSSGARLMTELVEGLDAGGIDVSVISARDMPLNGHADKIPVQRIPLPFGRTKNTGLRLFSEVLFSMLSALSLLGHCRGRDHVLILASPPFLPLFVGPIARLLRLSYSVILMDVYPDMASHLGLIKHGGWLFRFWNRWLVRVLESASGVVVIGECMKTFVESKSDKISTVVIPNWVCGKKVAPVSAPHNNYLAERPELDGKFVILYAGNMGLAQDFSTLLEAADLARDDQNLVFVMIGDGARRSEIESDIKSRGLTNVILYSFAAPELQSQFLSVANVALVTLEPGVEGLAVPSKFYGIIATGRPVIAILDPASEIGRTIEQYDLGVVLHWPSADDLFNAIDSMRERAGQSDMERIRNIFEDHFDAPRAIERYLAFLRTMDEESL